MTIRRFLYLFMLAAFVSCVGLTPALAQEESEELMEESTPKKKKGKKSKKSKKGDKKSKKKASKNSEEQVEEESDAEAEEKKGPSKPAVVEAMEKFNILNGKPNQKADYYIYLCSASWCGYCQACMPVAMEQYKKMKASRKVELIIIGGDKTEKEAVDYLKKYKSKNACIMFSALQATQFQGLPGVGMPGFPSISVVDKDGKMIKNVIGASQVKDVLTNWRELTIGKK